METDNKEIRKSINDTIKLFRGAVAVTLAGILACRRDFSPGKYLRALSTAEMNVAQAQTENENKTKAALYSQGDVGHPDVYEALKQWRKEKAAAQGVAHYQILHQKTLVQIAVHLPSTIKALKQIKGIGPRLAEKYGQEIVEMVAEYRREHQITEVVLPEPSVTAPPPKKSKVKETAKEDTKQVSLQLFEDGLPIAQIAARRGLVTTTIEGHLAHFVAQGQLEIGKLVADEKRLAIEEKVGVMEVKSLKELKTALGDGVSYGDIKLVLAHLDHRAQQGKG